MKKAEIDGIMKGLHEYGRIKWIDGAGSEGGATIFYQYEDLDLFVTVEAGDQRDPFGDSGNVVYLDYKPYHEESWMEDEDLSEARLAGWIKRELATGGYKKFPKRY